MAALPIANPPPGMQYDRITEDEVARALSYIDADLDRNAWWSIAAALKNEFAEQGFYLFDNWSQGGKSYSKADTRDTWKSTDISGGIGIGTLMAQAIAGGFKRDHNAPRISDAQAAARRLQREHDIAAAAEAKRIKHARAAERAVSIIDSARADPARAQPAEHPYVRRKGLVYLGDVVVGTYPRWIKDHESGEGHTERIPGALLIPARNSSGQIVSVQAIFPDADNALGRDRDYMPGAQKQGCYFTVGTITKNSAVVAIGEGYSTCSTVAEATEWPVMVAFDSGNLATVAAMVRERLPDTTIVLVGDDDRWNKSNDGRKYATAAAQAVSGYVVFPRFTDDSTRPTDWNDLASLEGLDKAREQLYAVLDGDRAQAAISGEESPGEAYSREHPMEAANDGPPRGKGAAPEWGRPVDVFGVAPPPAMPLDVLPEALIAYVADQADLTGCDPAIIGLASMVAAAACITDGIRLQPKRHDPTWTESARLWFAVVGDPSTKKSPAISKAVRHAKRIDHSFADGNSKSFGDWKFQHEQWKDAKKAKSATPIPEPERPAVNRLVVEDITVEALSDVLRDNSRGVLVLKDELTGWFAGMDAYKGGGKGASMDRAHWLEAYNGGRRTIDRVARGNTMVPNWSASIIGGIQPDMMRRIAQSMGNDGLLQRFIVLVAKPAVRDADRPPNMEAMDQFSSLFDQLVNIAPDSKNVVKLSEAAHESRIRVSNYAGRLIDAIDHAHIRAWLGKWDGLYARLLLLYHVIECATESVHPCMRQASGEAAMKVERLMCGTLLHHALHFYNEVLDSNDRQENTRQLARLLLARPAEKITKREIVRGWKRGGALEWWEVRAMLDSLASLGWVEADTTQIDTDGKPRTWWINPAIYDVFAGHAEREVGRRRSAVETIREIREQYDPDL